MPRPIRAKPPIAIAGCRAATISSPPAVASTPPTRTVRTAPKRATTLSPASRAAAMVQAKAVVDAAARPASVPSASRR